MAYTRAWDETHPFGTELAATLDTIIQNDKTDTRERIAGIFGLNLAQWTADPILPASLTLTGTLVAALLSGPLTGNVTGNLTGSVLTPAQANITSLGLLTSLNAVADPNNIQFKGSAGSAYIQLVGAPASGHFNWQIGKSVTVSGSLEFLPSTVVDGSTYTTPAAKLSQTGTLTCTTGNFTAVFGTLQTAAQPNITSLGTQGVTLNSTAQNVLAGTGQAAGFQYLRLTNTSGDLVLGIVGSVASNLFNNTLAYATVLGTATAQALQFATNNIVRQTIDSAGNVVFTGTVTAANFVGPTTLDANNLTGTTLNSGVVNSSLKNLGIQDSTLRFNTASVNEIQINTSPTNITQFLLGQGSANSSISTEYSGGYLSLAYNAAHTAKGTDNWHQQLNSLASSLVSVNSTGIGFYISPAGHADGTQAAFWGSLRASVDINGLVGNLTGTILTAAQANITSLGVLSNLETAGGARFKGFTAFGAGLGLEVGYDGTAAFIQGYNRTGAVFIPLRAFGLGIEFWSDGLAVRAQFDSSNRFLLGTTVTTGVAAGGLHAAGNSVFDGTVKTTSDSLWLQQTTLTGTSHAYWQILNTTGNVVLGLSSSTGLGIFASATSAYASCLTSFGNTDLVLGSNGVARLTIAGGGAVTANGAWTFNSTVGGITTLTATTLTGTLSTAAQTNVTSLGILTSLTISSGASAGLTLQANNGTAHVQYKNAASTVNWLTYLNNAGADLVFYDNINGRNALTLALGASGQATFSHGVTATTFTGNVTGNLTGTVLTAAQANITSLGTLTGLTLNGNLTLSAATTKILVGATALAVKDSTDTTTIASFSGSGADFSVSSLSIKISTVVDNAGLQLLTNRRTGWSSPTATLSRTAVATGDTLATTISHLAALVQDIITHGMIGA